MKCTNLKLMLGIFLAAGFSFFAYAVAQDLKEENQSLVEQREFKDKTRVEITTSGPVEFTSYLLDNPPRLIVEFQTKNVISDIDNELVLNEGAVKKIISTFFVTGKKRFLKSLTFELFEKVPFWIRQEADTILLDIQTPPKMQGSVVQEREVFIKSQASDIVVKKWEAMDTALKQVAGVPVSPQILPKETLDLMPDSKNLNRKIFWLIGLFFVIGTSGFGFLVWWFANKFLKTRENITKLEVTKLKEELQKKNERIKQQEIIRKAVEEASLQKEKEYAQTKQELQKKERLLEEKDTSCKTLQEKLSEISVKKEVVKELPKVRQTNEPRTAGKALDKRKFPRLDLSRNYNRTIILRIESDDRLKSIKSFADNISLGGFCFETRREFKENEEINLRLFFFGDKVPMIKTHARIVWRKTEPFINYYGASFVSLKEKDEFELSRYIESKLTKEITYV